MPTIFITTKTTTNITIPRPGRRSLFLMYLEICLYFSLCCIVVGSNTWLQTRKSVQLESSIIILRENHNSKVYYLAILSCRAIYRGLSIKTLLMCSKIGHQGHFAVKKSATIWSFCHVTLFNLRQP